MVMDFEDWEPDYDLCMREDWPELVRYRERVARRAPDNLYAQGRLGEAYVLNGEYERAIEFLSELYHEHPYYTDAEHYLLDALFALGKNENDFDWVEEPVVLRLSDELLDTCYSYLRARRGSRTVGEIHGWFFSKGYVAFDEAQLFEALKADDRFDVELEEGDCSAFAEVKVHWKRRTKSG
jgi:tetratricopeptide (TPR) repeat protein